MFKHHGYTVKQRLFCHICQGENYYFHVVFFQRQILLSAKIKTGIFALLENVFSVCFIGRFAYMKIGIYNHQHLRGGCPGCSQIYVKGMIKDGLECKSRVEGIYGTDCEFLNYTDLGDYPPENLDRPGYRRMMKDVEDGILKAIIVIRLDKISSDINLVLDTYLRLKEHNVEFLTLKEGKRAMEILDRALAAREAQKKTE